MMVCRYRLFLIVAMVVAYATVTLTCRGGEELTLEQYFAQLKQINDEMSEDSEELSEQLGAAMGSAFEAEEAADAYREFIVGIATTMRDYHDGLSEIDPPDDVSHAHEEILASAADSLACLEEAVQRSRDTTSAYGTLKLLFEISEDPDISAAGQRSEEACLALQSIADANDIEVDLECGE